MVVRQDVDGGLLGGLRILDLSIWRPGPYATQLLAGAGADVVKVEPPGGDPMRRYPRLFDSLNAGKRSIVLDLKSDAGRDEALRLAAAADVLVEGYRPGVATRLGVGHAEVVTANPTIIYCSISGMGQDGPLADVPGHDLNFQAWGGVLAPDGGTPVVPAVPVADLAGGMTAAFAICAAVIRRQRTGEGERIDLAMADVLATWTGVAAPEAADLDPDVRAAAGYGVYATADGGYVTIGVVDEDHFWRRLCDAVGLDEHRDLGFVERTTRRDELQALLGSAIGRRDRDDVVAALTGADVPVAPVLDRAEILMLPHFRARSVVVPDGDERVTGYPIRFASAPATSGTGAPTLDEHRGAAFRTR